MTKKNPLQDWEAFERTKRDKIRRKNIQILKDLRNQIAKRGSYYTDEWKALDWAVDELQKSKEMKGKLCKY